MSVDRAQLRLNCWKSIGGRCRGHAFGHETRASACAHSVNAQINLSELPSMSLNQSKWCVAGGAALLFTSVRVRSQVAQTYQGALRGAVRDAQGVIPGAEVILVNEDTNASARR